MVATRSETVLEANPYFDPIFSKVSVRRPRSFATARSYFFRSGTFVSALRSDRAALAIAFS
jgi:hypothetical protein